jgi:alpha-tubulin suppressor-like RCC1 family protein
VGAIAAGGEVVLALKTDGTVWQWTYGGAISRVSGLSRVAAIATGGGHHLALTVSGEVWAWGKNDRGQLGDGTAVDRAAR